MLLENAQSIELGPKRAIVASAHTLWMPDVLPLKSAQKSKSTATLTHESISLKTAIDRSLPSEVRFPSQPGHHSEANHANIPTQTRPGFRANRPPLFDGVV